MQSRLPGTASGPDPENVARIGAECVALHPAERGVGVPPESTEDRYPAEDHREHSRPARCGKDPQVEICTPTYISDCDRFRCVPQAAGAAQAAVCDVLHKPRSVLDASLLGG